MSKINQIFEFVSCHGFFLTCDSNNGYNVAFITSNDIHRGFEISINEDEDEDDIAYWAEVEIKINGKKNYWTSGSDEIDETLVIAAEYFGVK